MGSGERRNEMDLEQYKSNTDKEICSHCCEICSKHCIIWRKAEWKKEEQEKCSKAVSNS